MIFGNLTELFGTLDQYGNIQTVGEEYPDVPFYIPSSSTVAQIVTATMVNQNFTGGPHNG